MIYKKFLLIGVLIGIIFLGQSIYDVFASHTTTVDNWIEVFSQDRGSGESVQYTVLVNDDNQSGYFLIASSTAESEAAFDNVLPSVVKYTGASTTTILGRLNALSIATSTTETPIISFDGLNRRVGIRTGSPTTTLEIVGDCVGCTDIILPGGGVNLRDAKYVSATSSTLTANTIVDLYTVPSGRRALVATYSYFQATGASIAYTLQLKTVSGSYFNLVGSTTALSGTLSNITDGAIILEPGESLSVLTAATGGQGWLSVIEFSTDNPVFSRRAIDLASGTTTVYTVPSGKRLFITSVYVSLTNTSLTDNNSLAISIDNGAANSNIIAVGLPNMATAAGNYLSISESMSFNMPVLVAAGRIILLDFTGAASQTGNGGFVGWEENA